MRPLELALLLAALAAPLVTVAQALVEGLRWQMVPAYALAGALLLRWLAKAGGRSSCR